MRKFRNAALAIATATTVAVSGMSVASAEMPMNPDGDTILSDTPILDNLRRNLDPENKLEWEKPETGRAVFGSDSWKNFDDLSGWAQGAKILLTVTAIASVFGLLVAPAYNFLRYGLAR
ncbi:hypothetical protein [Corynebacterium auriscanis]|uniref:hypothetical protein n=1 Tax=Corynebacterium auriscanis TaxID=99807 RepID=UPI002247E0CC|nr:hypothetical protein [Corynebacterium auriscanis]MCX2163876.1 hypothetical protein [Corynebacterium auriscanis]